jgi:hypothetical protein
VARDVRLTVLVDGQKRPATETIDKIDAGKERAVEFDEVFARTGPHDVQVALPADALEQDNVRFLSINVPEANPVLIVDGGSGESEGFYLYDALGADTKKTGFAPVNGRLDMLRRDPLDKFQSIFLLNISELPPDAVKALEDYVRGGGGLAWYLGPQVRTAFYNDKLYKEGAGLFPARLAGMADLFVDETNPGPDMQVAPHTIFDVYQGSGQELLNYARVTRYFSVARDWIPPDGVQVIASLRNRAPLVLEHRLGKGRIVALLTACGTAWTNWPRVPETFVPVQLQMAAYLAQGRQTLNRKMVGEPLVISLEAAAYSPQVEILPPDGSRVPLTVGIRSSGSGSATPPKERPAEDSSPREETAKIMYEEAYKATDQPGVYALRVKRQDGGEETRRFAYNVADSESRLQLAATEKIRQRLPDVAVQIQEVGDFNWVHGADSTRDIHEFILMALVVILLAEQMLALRLSYHPKADGARA